MDERSETRAVHAPLHFADAAMHTIECIYTSCSLSGEQVKPESRCTLFSVRQYKNSR